MCQTQAVTLAVSAQTAELTPRILVSSGTLTIELELLVYDDEGHQDIHLMQWNVTALLHSAQDVLPFS
jgi:hypothetical protein